ncbi:tryptophan 7-halogenase [Oceanobacter mangrovi]|uniref:tryptophan 7-halogenase n=1 Tax=Oceanobacter mangrovi TaxID=2862510 RepID=UPI001C8E83A2|nr:tryptophan 7-halogenase [Oceanobacter mangrovi]
MSDYDVVIVGAGPAGCATALALQGAGVGRILLIDKPKSHTTPAGESAAPDVISKLQQLQLPTNLAEQGHQPCQANVSRWGGQRHVDDFLHRASGQGWHLDRQQFDLQLRYTAAERGVHLLTPATLQGLQWQPDQQTWQLTINYGGQQQTLSGDYLVDASARNNTVTRSLAVERKRIDNLAALAWTIADGERLAGLSMVEAIPQGWWYASCLPDGRGLIALMSDADLIRRYGWREPTALARLWQTSEELQQWFPSMPAARIQATPLAAQAGFLQQAAGPGWIAVGDALASFDPLTSSGISNALGDALAAAPVIQGWLQQRDLQPAEHYAERANRGVSRYLQQWLQQYGREKRWSDQPFWARRQLSQSQPLHQPAMQPG